MTKRLALACLFGATLTSIVLFSLLSCGNGEGTITNARKSCQQATECGEGGRLYFVCSPEHLCYTVKEYCTADSECIGTCKEHICTEGKKPVVIDGDTEAEPEFEGECPYDCCYDSDCRTGSTCDADTHICVVSQTCYDECCVDKDCINDIKFGEGYTCVKKHCKRPTDPCPTACCADTECKSGEACNDDGICYTKAVSCKPGFTKCCAADAENADCKALGALSSEAKLVCNPTGNAWMLEKCAANNDCQDQGNGSVSCFANGRCAADSDCACPMTCLDATDGTKHCQLPLVKEGDACMGDPCTTGQTQIARCPQGTTCCDVLDPIVCTKTADCVAPTTR